MLELLGILIFVFLIGLSIALHEWGHLWPAKRFGVKVTDYMIGFGPTIWSRSRGETRYGIKAFPVGGYIRMIGMLPPAPGDPEGTARSMTTGRFATMVAQARQQSLEEIGPGDADRVFYRLPVRKRMVIMLGGPVMNLIFGFVLFAILLMVVGVPSPSMEVASVGRCTPTVSQPAGEPLPSGECPTGSVPAPAAAAGFEPGDVIVSIDGTPYADWEAATDWIRANPGATTTVVVERNGAPVDLSVTIGEATRPVYDETGAATDEVVTAGYVGLAPAAVWELQSWTAVPGYMWDITVRSVEALVSLPVRLYELVTETLLGGGERQVDSPVSVVGVSRIGGEVAAMDQPIRAKVATFLGLAASLNLFLFLFNLLPILPLDGGHVAGAAYEGVRRRVARAQGRPDPGPVDIARLLPVAYVMAGVLLAMGVIVIWADLIKPISLG
jgi:membrane-associated protease RseP (regulator of RpoE activity)